jgi:hypothetical protein
MMLKPSVWLFLRTELGVLIVVSVVGYICQGLFGNLWWSSGYILSLAIPITLVLCVLWVWLVPLTMEISDDELRVRFLFRGDRKAVWSELASWGRGEVGLVLKFADGATVEIAHFAFPRGQRRYLIGFLNRHFSDRRAKGWFASWGLR